jgi:hypothetical protein
LVHTFQPAGPLGAAVDAVIARARTFGQPDLQWMDPAGLAGELEARGGAAGVVLDVLALDLSAGVPALPPASVEVTMRWATDFETAREAMALGVIGFGGELPPEDRIKTVASNDAANVPGGDGGMLVAYVGGRAAGSGGIVMADGVARLWGGVVAPSARGQGAYRAVLGARLGYGAANGATMALVKGRIDTSGPILRRAGFGVFGQETLYTIPL